RRFADLQSERGYCRAAPAKVKYNNTHTFKRRHGHFMFNSLDIISNLYGNKSAPCLLKHKSVFLKFYIELA
ncbi:MAG TPA: hypothetical protein PLQ81_11830, partial [bacterium]|nr:hypothetical protein [bacterium]